MSRRLPTCKKMRHDRDPRLSLCRVRCHDRAEAANNADTGHAGLVGLMELGRVRRFVCSFPRSASSMVFEELYNAEKLELEIMPRGTLAERLQAAGRACRPVADQHPQAARDLAAGRQLLPPRRELRHDLRRGSSRASIPT